MTFGTPLPSRREGAAHHAGIERAHAEGPTQHGGSGKTSGWTGRPGLARALRFTILILPSVVSFIVTFVLARKYPPYEIGVSRLFWWVSLFSVGVLVMLATELLSRRLLPLAALFKLSLVFPDAAPSRFNLAMKTNSTRKLERRLQEVQENGIPDDSAEHAALMLELVASLSLHDRLTRGHCERVRAYTDMISEEMKLSEEDSSKLRWSALLHDVGKIYVSADILNKEGRPTEDEWESLKSHTWKGDDLIEPLRDFLGPWAYAVRNHHERWDGNGYPDNLGGKDIPLGARIVAVADAFDVMTSARSYKEPRPATEAREEIARCAGGQFDPEVARAFLNIGLGRLRFAVGPLSWLANISAVGNAPAIIGTAASQTAGSFVATAAATVVALGGFGGSPPTEIAFEAPVTTVTVPEVTEPPTVETSGPTIPETQPEPQPVETTSDEPPLITPQAQSGVVTLVEDTVTSVVLTTDAPDLESIFILIEGPKQGSLSLTGRESSLSVLTSGVYLPIQRSALAEGVEFQPSFQTAGQAATMTASYVPNTDFYGDDDFRFRVCNAAARTLCSDAVVSLQITADNDPPVARDNSISIDEDTNLKLTPTLVLSNDSDVEGDALTVKWYRPSTGTSSIEGTTFNYLPPANSTRSFKVRYEACDATLCTEAYVNVDVVAADDKPVANNDEFTTSEDTALEITEAQLRANDEEHDGEDVEFAWLTVPDFDEATSIFQPQLNSTDPVELSYQLCDAGGGLCDQATVTVQITPQPDTPLAEGEALVLVEDTLFERPLDVLLSNDDDPDGEQLSVKWGDPTVAGLAFTKTATTVSFQPPADFVGAIELPYQACAGTRCSPVVVVALDYLADNDPPRLDSGLAFPGVENNPTTVALSDILDSATDVDSDSTDLRVEFNQPTPSGFALGPDPANPTEFTYSPARHSIADVEVPYEVCDDFDDCAAGILTLTFTEQDDPPEPNVLVDTTDEDNTFKLSAGSFETLAGDPDSPLTELTFTFTQTNPVLGTPSYDSASGEFEYEPAPNEFGQTVITFTVCDQTTTTGCPSGTITLTVEPDNDAPRIIGPIVSEQHQEDDIVTFTEADMRALVDDVDSDMTTLTFNFDPVTTGNFVQAGQGFEFTPDPEYVGPVTIRYQVCDDEPLCSIDTGEIQLEFTIVDDPPNPVDIVTPAVLEDPPGPIVVTRAELVAAANDIDTVDADLTFSASTPSLDIGDLLIQPNQDWHFTPDLNANGLTTFEFQVCDSNTPIPNCAPFDVTFEVTPDNDRPKIDVLTVTFPGDEDVTTQVTEATLQALNLVSDPDSPFSELTFGLTDPGSGLLITADGFEYKPIDDSNADVVIDFVVCDITLCSDETGQMTFTFAPDDDPPSANDLVIAPFDEDPLDDPGFTRAELEAASTDIDTALTQLTYNVIGYTGDNLGTWVDPGDGGLELNLLDHANGTATYTATVCDDSNCDFFEIDVAITPINDPPTIVTGPTGVATRFNPAVGVILPVDYVIEDHDFGDIHTLTPSAVPPTTGTLAPDGATGEWIFTPNPTFSGAQVTIPFDVCDDFGDCASSQWVIDEVPNAAPVISAISFVEQHINIASTPVNFTVTDAEGDPLTIVEQTLPAGLTMSGSSGNYTISGTSTDASFLGQAIPYTLRFSDGADIVTASGTVSYSDQGLSPDAGNVIFTEVGAEDINWCVPLLGCFLVEAAEIHNRTGSSIDTNGWTIRNFAPGAAADATLPIGTSLNPSEYYYKSTFLSGFDRPFNFSGDDLWLMDDNGLIVDYVGWQQPGWAGPPIDIPDPVLGLWDADRSHMSAFAGRPGGTSFVITTSLVTTTDANTGACWEWTTSGNAVSTCPAADTNISINNPAVLATYPGFPSNLISSIELQNYN